MGILSLYNGYQYYKYPLKTLLYTKTNILTTNCLQTLAVNSLIVTIMKHKAQPPRDFEPAKVNKWVIPPKESQVRIAKWIAQEEKAKQKLKQLEERKKRRAMKLQANNGEGLGQSTAPVAQLQETKADSKRDLDDDMIILKRMTTEAHNRAMKGRLKGTRDMTYIPRAVDKQKWWERMGRTEKQV
jgi:hypothetical protein